MLTQRLGSRTQKDPAFVDALIAEITAHPGCCDEVWLATNYGFPSMDVHRQTAETLREVAEKFRKIGIRVSLQLSNSIGHGQYMQSQDCSGLVYDGSPVEHMVGSDGTSADYCFCWNGPNFRRYVMEELRAYVTAIQPHTLWVDDDLRATNHDPVRHGCFCPDCVAAFNQKYGSSFTREELVNAINSPEDDTWRLRHIGFLRESLYDFTYEMGTVIHECAPDCAMGYQYCANGGYTGFGYDFIFDAMRKSTGKDPASRPGGGSYNDHNPNTFIDKAELLGYQNYMLPDYVHDRRPEIESLPDIVYGKSIGGTCFETSYYLASGNNAMSHAILMNDYEPMSWHGQMLGAFAKHRPYWKKLCEYNNRSRAAGLKPALTHEGFRTQWRNPFEYSVESFYFGLPFRYFNIPVAMTREDCDVYLLNVENARRMTESEVRDLLGRPVITDGASVQALIDRGFDVGAKVQHVSTRILSETFTDHAVNRGFAGHRWGGTWGHNSDWEILGDHLEVLGTYVPTNGTVLDREYAASAAFVTPYGAKWAVIYNMWERGISSEKRDQYRNAMEYISGTKFAAELVTPIQAILHPRVDADGKLVCVSVTNVSVGDSGELDVILRNPAGTKFIYMGQYSDEVVLDAEDLGNGEYRVKIPDIHGWSVGTIFVE